MIFKIDLYLNQFKSTLVTCNLNHVYEYVNPCFDGGYLVLNNVVFDILVRSNTNFNVM